MKIQTRILLLLFLLMALFAGSLMALRKYQGRQLREVITVRAAEREASFDSFIEKEGEPLEVLLKEVANVSSTARAVQSNDVAWAVGNLNLNQLVIYEANALWLYQPGLKLFYSVTNLYHDALDKVPTTAEVLRDVTERGEAVHSFLPTDLGWIEIRGAPLEPEARHDPSGSREVPGYVFVGRLWSQPYLRDLSLVTGSTVSIASVEKAALIPVGISEDGRYRFKRPLPNWSEETDAYLIVDNAIVGIPELHRAFGLLFVTLFTFGVLLLLAVGFLTWLWVSRPLRLISESLNHNDLSGISSLRARRSEFGRLAGLIHHFFEQRETLVSETRERRNTQKALSRSEEQLRHAQKMDAVGRLAGGVAHDFNNLLTGIIGYSELLMTKLGVDDPMHEAAEAIAAAGERAAGLTRQLLALSRKQVLQPRVLDLNCLVQDLSKLLHRVLGERTVLRCEFCAEPARVNADPGQLEQVIVNLCVNARDALPEGGEIHLQTSNERRQERGAETEWVVLSVQDSGVGMDAETRQKLFEPFFTTKPPGSGTGLGLATVYGIVSQSGGSIEVDSEEGRGSVFRVFLPLNESEVCAPEPPRSPVIREQTNETILVAEDEEFVRQLICEVLTDQGYRVLAAEDGMAALEKMHAHPGTIDLLLSDVVMPRINGIELARLVVAARPGIGVLFVSGYANAEVDVKTLRATAVDSLAKPFSPTVLLGKVREVLDRAAGESAGRTKAVFEE